MLWTYVPAQAQSLSAASIECIRSVVWAEARGESKRGQAAVAYVILNRARQGAELPCSVVARKGQFVRGRPPASFKVDIPPTDPTGGATHFRVKHMDRWLGLKPYVRIGNHTYYGK